MIGDNEHVNGVIMSVTIMKVMIKVTMRVAVRGILRVAPSVILRVPCDTLNRLSSQLWSVHACHRGTV